MHDLAGSSSLWRAGDGFGEFAVAEAQGGAHADDGGGAGEAEDDGAGEGSP